MAAEHVKYNDQTDIGRLIKSGINTLYEGRAKITEAKNQLAQMKESGVVTTYIQTEAGCQTLEDAEDLVGEIEALEFKLVTNDSQTSVGDAITQANAKLG